LATLKILVVLLHTGQVKLSRSQYDFKSTKKDCQ